MYADTKSKLNTYKINGISNCNIYKSITLVDSFRPRCIRSPFELCDCHPSNISNT